MSTYANKHTSHVVPRGREWNYGAAAAIKFLANEEAFEKIVYCSLVLRGPGNKDTEVRLCQVALSGAAANSSKSSTQ